MTLLGIDIETTGLLPGSQILTLFMGVIDNNYNIIQALDLKVKPDSVDGRTVYSHIEVEALAVNKIDLQEHDKLAVPYKQAKTMLYKWLEDMYTLYGTLTPFGNSVGGDVNKICECLISRVSWNNFCDPRTIDLVSIGKTLQLLGVIPETQSLSLSGMSGFFGSKINKKMVHTAQYDVELGAFVLKKYMEKLK
jgi:hypothetical protein